MLGGQKVLINLKEKSNNKLVVKDYLDIDFDMAVEEIKKERFVININKKYTYAVEYNTIEEAEDAMIAIMNNRNHLEYEYKDF